jgi:hypothetical protein
MAGGTLAREQRRESIKSLSMPERSVPGRIEALRMAAYFSVGR